MEKKYLIVNPGSTSKKYALYGGGELLLSAHLEIKEAGHAISLSKKGVRDEKTLTKEEYRHGPQTFIDLCIEEGDLRAPSQIQAIGFRVVAPGTFFQESRIINAGYLKKLNAVKKLAPLHIQVIINEMNLIQSSAPAAIKVGVSDSAFHRTIPAHARLYAIPRATAKDLDIYRFGYHGLSVRSVTHKIKELLGRTPPNILVCHLGGGASVTALKNGRSIDTSMGFTPAEGLMMSTRTGDLDPLALPYLSHKLRLSYDQITEFVDNRSGLLGISGVSGDIRTLLKQEKNGDKDAVLALEMFIYRIKKYIGAYTASLGELDVLAFSGAAGERSAVIRERICRGLEYLNIHLDQKKNSGVVNSDSFIEAADSPVKIVVVKTDEMREAALEMEGLLSK